MKEVKKWKKELKARQNAIAKERDKLDLLIGEMEALRDSCDRAWEHLEEARDALSELV